MNPKTVSAIEETLQRLALNGDLEAARQNANLQRFRRDYDSNKSAENWNDLVYAAQGAHAWLSINRNINIPISN